MTDHDHDHDDHDHDHDDHDHDHDDHGHDHDDHAGGHDHAARVSRRLCDVVVTDPSDVGVRAAIALAVAGSGVIVVDPHRDGMPSASSAVVAEARSNGVEVLCARATRVDVTATGVDVTLTGGHVIAASRLVDDGAAVAPASGTAAAAGSSGGSGRSFEDDWDHRYSGERVWSGNPNGTLVAEVADLAPGSALDVGAGEGGDALWLAERGWRVTANDVSSAALGTIAAEARRRGHEVATCHADAGADDPFGGAVFDLVSAQYASIHRSPDGRAERNLLAAVAPGGLLLVVGHDLTPMRAPVDTARASRVFDPDAYVGVDQLRAAVDASDRFDVELHETRPRPPGAASTHHVDDVVLRARRRR